VSTCQSVVEIKYVRFSSASRAERALDASPPPFRAKPESTLRTQTIIRDLSSNGLAFVTGFRALGALPRTARFIHDKTSSMLSEGGLRHRLPGSRGGVVGPVRAMARLGKKNTADVRAGESGSDLWRWEGSASKCLSAARHAVPQGSL